MNAPLHLFDDLDASGRTNVRRTVQRRLAALPRSRHSDPSTSREAAVSVKPGCKECIDAVREVVGFHARQFGPVDAFFIAACVEGRHPGRWDEGTIRRRVKDAGLTKVDEDGVSPRGRACERFTL